MRVRAAPPPVWPVNPQGRLIRPPWRSGCRTSPQGQKPAVAKGLAMLHPTRMDRLLHAARRFLDSLADGAGRGFIRR